MTDRDFNQWRFQHYVVHINGGKEFFGWGHRCIDQPRLMVIDKYFKRDRSTQRSYIVDGRTPCTTPEEVMAILSLPPKLSDEERMLLASISPDWFRPEKRGPLLPLADTGFIEWGRDADDEVTCRLTAAGRDALTKAVQS